MDKDTKRDILIEAIAETIRQYIADNENQSRAKGVVLTNQVTLIAGHRGK